MQCNGFMEQMNSHKERGVLLIKGAARASKKSFVTLFLPKLGNMELLIFFSLCLMLHYLGNFGENQTILFGLKILSLRIQNGLDFRLTFKLQLCQI